MCGVSFDRRAIARDMSEATVELDDVSATRGTPTLALPRITRAGDKSVATSACVCAASDWLPAAARGAYDRGMAGKDEKNLNPRINNRRALHDYHIEAKLECGIALKGTEVKSLRLGLAQLHEAFARIEQGELWLYG